MKSLFQYIIEARGVVTGKDSWSDLVDDIAKTMVYGDETTRIWTTGLPDWIKQLTVTVDQYIIGGIAVYADELTKVVDNKLIITIKVSKQAFKSISKFKSTLEHELQHAYDDYIGRTRRGKSVFIGDKYCVPTKYESPDFESTNIWDIITNPKNVTTDHMQYLLRESTYWFDQSEVNAFLREFNLYIKSVAVKNGFEWDWNDVFGNPNDGALPLTGISLIYHTINHINEYTNVEWDWAMDAVNDYWAPTVFNKTFPGKDANSFVRVLQYILKKMTPKVIARYSRVIKDNDIDIINKPDWFK